MLALSKALCGYLQSFWMTFIHQASLNIELDFYIEEFNNKVLLVFCKVRDYSGNCTVSNRCASSNLPPRPVAHVPFFLPDTAGVGRSYSLVSNKLQILSGCSCSGGGGGAGQVAHVLLELWSHSLLAWLSFYTASSRKR